MYKGPFTLCVFFFEICVKRKEYTYSLRLTQHPIDAMLQFDAKAKANVDASVNGP